MVKEELKKCYERKVAHVCMHTHTYIDWAKNFPKVLFKN